MQQTIIVALPTAPVLAVIPRLEWLHDISVRKFDVTCGVVDHVFCPHRLSVSKNNCMDHQTKTK